VRRILPQVASSSASLTGPSAGEPAQLLEEDDGSGWVKLEDSTGAKGLVPASYVELSGSGSGAGNMPATLVNAPLQGGRMYGKPMKDVARLIWWLKHAQVRVVYTYDSQGSDELSLHEGDIIELSAGPTGGQNYGDGWWEGINTSGRKGIFPSNYVSCF